MPKKAVTKTKVVLKTCKFVLFAPDASKVVVTGSFNNWDEEKKILRKDKKDGLWKISLRLKPGKYSYKFIVDGNWWTDPLNSAVEWNEHGTQNSVLILE